MRCEHDHESEHCPLCTDDPEEAARRTATATGFAGSVLGAVGMLAFIAGMDELFAVVGIALVGIGHTVGIAEASLRDQSH